MTDRITTLFKSGGRGFRDYSEDDEQHTFSKDGGKPPRGRFAIRILLPISPAALGTLPYSTWSWSSADDEYHETASAHKNASHTLRSRKLVLVTVLGIRSGLRTSVNPQSTSRPLAGCEAVVARDDSATPDERHGDCTLTVEDVVAAWFAYVRVEERQLTVVTKSYNPHRRCNLMWGSI